jgi:hypothetical protein
MWAPEITLNPRGRSSCSDLEMTRGVPVTEALLDLGKGGIPFAVAHGLREVTVTAQFSRGSCSAPPDEMETSIVVAVTDGPDDIPLFTDLASEQTVCLLMRNGGQLAASETGLGVVDTQGDLRQVIWPIGYTARRMEDGGAVLVGGDRQVVAHTGDHVIFDALTPDDGLPLRPCGEVQAVDDDASQTPSARGEIELKTAPVPTLSDGTRVCMTALKEGILARNPRTGLGFAPDLDIVWADGYSAWLEDGVAVLRNASDALVASEGDHMTVLGGYQSDGSWFAC